MGQHAHRADERHDIYFGQRDPLQTQDAALISQATGSNTAAQSLVAGLSNYGYIANGASFTLDEPLNLTNGLFVETTANDANITVADAVSQSAKDKIRLDATGNIAVDAGISTAGTISLGSAGTITLASSIYGINGVTLNSTGSLVVDKKISSASGTVTLTSGGTITETGAGVIDAQILTGSSVGGTTLNGANLFGTLDAFANAGAGGFTLNDNEALSLDDAISAGTGNLSLTTSGYLNGESPFTAGGTLTLTAGGAISVGNISAPGSITLSGTNLNLGVVSTAGTVSLTGV